MNGTLDGALSCVRYADGSSAGRLLIKGLGSSSGLNDFGGVPEFHPCCGPRCDDFTGHAALGFSLVRKHTVPVSTDERRGEPLLFILRRAVRVLEFGEIL